MFEMIKTPWCFVIWLSFHFLPANRRTWKIFFFIKSNSTSSSVFFFFLRVLNKLKKTLNQTYMLYTFYILFYRTWVYFQISDMIKPWEMHAVCGRVGQVLSFPRGQGLTPVGQAAIFLLPLHVLFFFFFPCIYIFIFLHSRKQRT